MKPEQLIRGNELKTILNDLYNHRNNISVKIASCEEKGENGLTELDAHYDAAINYSRTMLRTEFQPLTNKNYLMLYLEEVKNKIKEVETEFDLL